MGEGVLIKWFGGKGLVGPGVAAFFFTSLFFPYKHIWLRRLSFIPPFGVFTHAYDKFTLLLFYLTTSLSTLLVKADFLVSLCPLNYLSA